MQVGELQGDGLALYSPPLQGSNGTFLLSLGGPDAGAFSVSPQRAAGSADVQVLVRDPERVDYENKTVMLMQVRGAPRSWGEEAMGQPGPGIAAFSVLRLWPPTRSARTPLLPR